MPKNYNIITKAKAYTTGNRQAIGSSVAAGMTRYVTYVRVEKSGTNQKGQGIKFILASAAASTGASTLTLASAAQKFQVVKTSAITAQTQDNQYPDKINTENPLFTIAASKWLVGFCASANTFSAPVNVFVQYYDQ